MWLVLSIGIVVQPSASGAPELGHDGPPGQAVHVEVGVGVVRRGGAGLQEPGVDALRVRPERGWQRGRRRRRRSQVVRVAGPGRVVAPLDRVPVRKDGRLVGGLVLLPTSRRETEN